MNRSMDVAKVRWCNEICNFQPMKEISENKEGEDKAQEASTEQKTEKDDQLRTGEKRKRSPSPGAGSGRTAQKRRSRSPIREDEPVVDSEKVQLSWCK